MSEHEQVQYAIMEWPTDDHQVSILHLKNVISPKKPWNCYRKGDVGKSKYPGANGEWPFIIHEAGGNTFGVLLVKQFKNTCT